MIIQSTIWRKLFMLFISVGLVSYLVLGFLSYRELKREKLLSIETNLGSQVEQLEMAVDAFFSNIASNVMLLAQNPLVRTRQDSDFTNFTQADEKTFAYHIGETEEKVRNLFALYQENFEYVNSVYMGRENGGFVRSRKRARPTRYDPRQREWYQLARKNPGVVVRTKPYRSVTTDDINIGTTTALVDHEGKVFGVVGMDVTLKDLSRFVTNMEMDYGGKAALITRQGDVFATAWPSLKGKNIKEIFPDEAESILGLDRGCRITETGNLALCHVTANRLDWKIMVVTPMKAINAELFSFSVRLLTIIFLLMALLGILVGMGLQHFVIRPIKKLSFQAEDISRTGKLTTFIHTGSNDEIGALGRSFNRMVTKLKEMDHQLRRHSSNLEETVRIRTAELAEANQDLENELGLRYQVEQDLKIQKIYLEQFFGMSPEAIVLIDNENRVLRVNAEFTRVFGYSREEIMGQSLFETIIPKELWNDGHTVRNQIVSGQKIPAETRRQHKDGHLVDVSVIGTTVELGGNHHGIFAIYRDITQKKYQEEELRRAKETAESADRLKSAFLASMSHELRTPLNSIIGFTGILLQELPGPLNEEQQKQMGMVQKSARHLLDLINDVLDISKIEAGQLQLASERFVFKESVDKVMSIIGPMTEKKGLAHDVQVDPAIGEIRTDRRRLEQVLLNLLSNAVKFTDQGSVRVTSQLQGQRIITRVTDTGIGINNNDMSTLFKAFSQIDTGLSRRYEGTGLGLSICQRLIEMMGGRVWAESEGPGRGSTFVFDLPWNR